MKKRKKAKTLDTMLIESVGNLSLLYPNCASLIKGPDLFFPDANTSPDKD